MKKPPDVIDIFLQPGDFYFGNSSTRIRTLLGSCVSITMWHPGRLIGGMCHFMLPSRLKRTSDLQGKYADEAIDLFIQQAARYKTRPKDYQIKFFGGGNMFPRQTANKLHSVSNKNIEAAHMLLAKHNLSLHSTHVGLTGHRNIIFDIWSGHVWVRHQPILEPEKRL